MPAAAGQKFATQTSVDMLSAMATPPPLRLLAQALRRELYNISSRKLTTPPRWPCKMTLLPSPLLRGTVGLLEVLRVSKLSSRGCIVYRAHIPTFKPSTLWLHGPFGYIGPAGPSGPALPSQKTLVIRSRILCERMAPP